MKYETIQMKKQGWGDAIVNNSSLAGKVGVAQRAQYVAAKRGMLGLTKSAALEAGREGIRINAICPGTIDTPTVHRMVNDKDLDTKLSKAAVPLGRLGTVEEIAHAVLWLCSNGSSYVMRTAFGRCRCDDSIDVSLFEVPSRKVVNMIPREVSTFLEPLLGPVRQLGYVVKDLGAAIGFWTNVLRVGTFVVIEEAIGDRDFVYKGAKRDIRASLGFCYCGYVQLELVQQVNTAVSPYRDFLDDGREDLHHVAFFPDDYERCCDQLRSGGLAEVAWVAGRDGVKTNSFFDGPSGLGYLIELNAVTPERLTYYEGFKLLAQSWDGSRPIRRYKKRAVLHRLCRMSIEMINAAVAPHETVGPVLQARQYELTIQEL